jgi:chromosome segregation ATPase
MAQVLTIWIGLAAKFHPEEVKQALGSLFDLTVIQERLDYLAQQADNMRADCEQYRELVSDLRRELEETEKRRDVLFAENGVLSERLKKLESRLDSAAKYVGQLKKEMANGRNSHERSRDKVEGCKGSRQEAADAKLQG